LETRQYPNLIIGLSSGKILLLDIRDLKNMQSFDYKESPLGKDTVITNVAISRYKINKYNASSDFNY
jgi:hypothetical protein